MATVDDGYWSWVKHVPPGGDIPDDLAGPTKLSNVNFVIRVLESELVGNDIVEVLGRFLTEVAQYNSWFAQHVDGKVPPERHAALYTVYRDITETVYGPWKDYEIACGSAPPDGDIEPEYQAFLAALEDAVVELSEARKSLSTR